MQQPRLSDVPGQALDIAKCLAVARADLDLNELDECRSLLTLWRRSPF